MLLQEDNKLCHGLFNRCLVVGREHEQAWLDFRVLARPPGLGYRWCFLKNTMCVRTAKAKIVDANILLLGRPWSLCSRNLAFTLAGDLLSVDLLTYLDVPFMEWNILIRRLEVWVRQNEAFLKHHSCFYQGHQTWVEEFLN